MDGNQANRALTPEKQHISSNKRKLKEGKSSKMADRQIAEKTVKRNLANAVSSLSTPEYDPRQYIPNYDWITVDCYNNPVKHSLLKFHDFSLNKTDLSVLVCVGYPLTLWYGEGVSHLHVYGEEYLYETHNVGQPDEYAWWWPMHGPFTRQYENDPKRLAREEKRREMGLDRLSRRRLYFNKQFPNDYFT